MASSKEAASASACCGEPVRNTAFVQACISYGFTEIEGSLFEPCTKRRVLKIHTTYSGISHHCLAGANDAEESHRRVLTRREISIEIVLGANPQTTSRKALASVFK